MQSASSTQISGLLVLLLYIAVFAGTIVLQVYLSRRENRWPGLILPILSFGLALLAVLAVVVLNSVNTRDVVVTSPEDTVSTEPAPVEPESGVGEAIIGGGIVFLIGNVPTLIYIAVYFGEREIFRRKEQMKRMNIQDLE